ncbi:MAG: hypothetical protein AB7N91_02125 [Candidatus Tectimicrobiota bacterium]
MIPLWYVLARVGGPWCVLALLLCSGCSAPYHFRYQSTLVAPADGSDSIEDERVRVRVTPTTETGVLQLTVINKTLQPLTIVWSQTYYVDPLGRQRPTLDASTPGIFGPQPWPTSGTRVVPGDALQTMVRPAGLRTARVQSLSPYAGQLDMHVPPSPEARTPPQASDRLTATPLTLTWAKGEGAHLSTSPQPLLPASGSTPSLGQAYKDREFRFVLGLRFETRVVPYTFTFRITDVEVQQSAAPAN